MTGKVLHSRETLPSGATLARVALNAPERCNSLEPGLLDALNAALDAVAGADAILLTAAGRHFSTGGDVAAFLDAAEAGRAEDHAERTVGALHDAILKLRRGPVAVCAAQGAVTGGAAGLPLAADLTVLAKDAFLQPYYALVGYAPDGGWTAQLPELVGARRALEIQLRNRRIPSREALALGLAEEVATDGLADAAEALLARLDGHDWAAMRAAKRLVWDDARLATLAARLDAEKAAFRDRIGRPETADGMRRFLRALKAG